jgi:hypothetical protein
MVLLTTIFIVALLVVSLYGTINNESDVSLLQTVVMTVGVLVIGLAGMLP